MSETELSRSIQSALEGLGALVTRIQSGSLRGAGGHVQCARKGTPDLHVLYRGFNGFLEVKTDTGELSGDQAAWHAEARQHGGAVYVVRSTEQALRIVRGA